MKKRFNSSMMILLLIFSFHTGNAQKEGIAFIDSLKAELPKLSDDTNKVKTLSLLSLELSYCDLDKGIEAGKQSLNLAEKLKFDYGIAISKLSLARNYFYQSKFHLLLKNALEAERVFIDMNDYDRLCAIYCLLSISVNEVDKQKGLEYYKKAKSCWIKSKDTDWRIRNLGWIVSISNSHERDSTAILGFQYQQLCKSSKSERDLAYFYLMKAEYYETFKNKKDYDSALFFRELALPIFLRLQQNFKLAIHYYYTGNIYFEKEKNHTSTLNDKGQAEECYKRCIAYAEEYGSLWFTAQGYYQLYEVQKSHGRIDQALSSLELYNEKWLSFIESTNASRMDVFAYNYEIDLKQKELKFLKKQNAIRLNVIIAGTIGVLLILLTTIMLIVAWRRNLQLKRRETDHQMITLEQKALQSMMNPHFIFNALGSIQNFLLQNKSSEAGLYLSQFARLIRQNLSAINSAMINLEEEVDRFKNYLDLERLRMENKFDYTIEYEDGIEEDDVMIPSMIIQPFVENAVWHGISALEGNGIIRISFAMQSPKSLKISVEDNGIGIKQADAYSSRSENHLHMGMAMTRKRLEIIGRRMNIQTSVAISEASPGTANPGTRVVIFVPVSYGKAEI